MRSAKSCEIPQEGSKKMKKYIKLGIFYRILCPTCVLSSNVPMENITAAQNKQWLNSIFSKLEHINISCIAFLWCNCQANLSHSFISYK